MSAPKNRRLRPGELDGLVLSYLCKHREDGPRDQTFSLESIRTCPVAGNSRIEKSGRAAGLHQALADELAASLRAHDSGDRWADNSIRSLWHPSLIACPCL